MALQSSGTIKLSEIQTEFGGSNPISLSEYYGSGGVPSSGVLSLSDFYGTSAGSVNLPVSTQDIEVLPLGGTAFASITFNTDGTISRENGSDLSWWTASPSTGIGSSYEVRITSVTGTTPTGPTAGTWTAISSAVTWSITTTGADQNLQSNFTIEIRDTATSTTQDTGAGYLNANNETI